MYSNGDATSRLIAERKALKQAGFKKGNTILIKGGAYSGWATEQIAVEVLHCSLEPAGERRRLRFYFVIHFPRAIQKYGFRKDLQTWSFHITCRENHPHGAPVPWITSKLPRQIFCPHLMNRGATNQPCLFDPGEGPSYGWNNDCTVATMALWVIQWILAYLVWLKEGTWPGRSGH